MIYHRLPSLHMVPSPITVFPHTRQKLQKTSFILVAFNLAFFGGLASNAQSANNLSPFSFNPSLIAQDVRSAGTTILPTDIVPLPAGEDRSTFNENFQLRLLQRLPSKFYFTGIVESSFRNETNVFQNPNKRSILNKFGPPILLSPQRRVLEIQEVRNANRDDNVFRVLPNLTAGWAFTTKTRAFANYFLIRDSLFHNVGLNATIQSIGGGVQHDFPLGKRALFQTTAQFRELYQTNQINVFDFLPSATLSYALTPRTIVYSSALLQLRGKQPFVAPNREIDPFYNFGVFYQRGPWAITSSGTFLQNFREPFRRNALIPINNYSWILDFEVARRVSKKVPGLQAFVRAEPIYNFHSGATPGLSGVDFRIFYGLRMTVNKPALNQALKDIRQQLEDQELRTVPPNLTPPPPGPRTPSGQPFSYLRVPPCQLVASGAQPIHGYKSETDPQEPTKSLVAPAHLAALSEIK